MRDPDDSFYAAQIALLEVERHFEVARHVFEDEQNKYQWSLGRFTLKAIPFPLSAQQLARWSRAGFGPQSRKTLKGREVFGCTKDYYSIREMHDFLWCKDIKEFPQHRRRFINKLRLVRLDNKLQELEIMIKGIVRVSNGNSASTYNISDDAWKKHYLTGPRDGFKNLKEILPMFKTTGDLRSAMIKLYGDVESGAVTASVARTKVQVAKTIVDTLKVEIAAANLGKQFGLVRFDEIENSTSIRRVA